MNYLLLKACKHGNYGRCLKCGHTHPPSTKLCHKEHKMKPMKLTKEDLKLIEKLRKKRNE